MHHASQLPSRVPRLRSVVVGNMANEVASDDFTLPTGGGCPVVFDATPGQTLVISTTLAGDPPFAHQWLRNGQAIAGAAGVGDSPLLQLTTRVLTAADDGVQYSVVVASAAGSVRAPVAVIYLSNVNRVVGIRSREALRTEPVQIPALASIDRRVIPPADTDPAQSSNQ